jgi:hypothetical protein
MHVCVPGATGLNGPAAASHHPHLELVLTEDTAVQRARVVTGIELDQLPTSQLSMGNLSQGSLRLITAEVVSSMKALLLDAARQ